LIKKISSRPTKVIKQETLNLYCFDLKEEMPNIEPRITVAFEMSDQPLRLDNVDLEDVERRITRGDLIFFAVHRAKVVAYLFASTTSCEVGELEDMLAVGPGEVYFYDAFTSMGFRGNHIYPALLTFACNHFKKSNFAFSLIFSRGSNRNSVKGIEKAGFSCYQVIRFVNRFGEKSWNYSARSKNVRSRFNYEN
jgi:hypothetical protein